MAERGIVIFPHVPNVEGESGISQLSNHSPQPSDRKSVVSDLQIALSLAADVGSGQPSTPEKGPRCFCRGHQSSLYPHNRLARPHDSA
jgi:hypothetical protein